LLRVSRYEIVHRIGRLLVMSCYFIFDTRAAKKATFVVR